MKLTVYFDGACGFCGSVVRFYRKRDFGHQLHFVDITGASFSAKDHGLDPVLITKKMYAKDESGTLYSGGDAVIQIWKTLPQYRLHAKVFGAWPIRPFFNLGYMIFARYIRPLISNKDHCEL